MSGVLGVRIQGASLEANPLGSYEKSTFEEDYLLGKQIGEGQFGSVHETHHISKPRETFAVKIMHRRCRSDEETAVQEASILHHLRNIPNVIRLIDFYINDNEMYSVQVLAEGGDVFDRLIQKETYTEKCARDLAKILLTTVDNIHQHGVVHRDLKLENLLLLNQYDDAEILLCDFDSAKHLRNIDERMRTLCGTEAYLAPEIMEGAEYGMEIDMWSVGCIMYIILGGYLPFGDGEEGDLEERVTNADFDFDDECWDVVSDDAKGLICHLLNVDPYERCTAKQALESNWFLETRKKRLSQTDLRDSLSNIRRYCARRKLKAAVNVVQISNKLKLLASLHSHKSLTESLSDSSGSDELSQVSDIDMEAETKSADRKGGKLQEIETKTETDNMETRCTKMVDGISTKTVNEQHEREKVDACTNSSVDISLEMLNEKHEKEIRELRLLLASHQAKNDELQRVNRRLEEEKDDMLLELDSVKSERDSLKQTTDEAKKELKQMKFQQSKSERETSEDLAQVSRKLRALKDQQERESHDWNAKLKQSQAENARYQVISAKMYAILETHLQDSVVQYSREMTELQGTGEFATEELLMLKTKLAECREIKRELEEVKCHFENGKIQREQKQNSSRNKELDKNVCFQGDLPSRKDNFERIEKEYAETMSEKELEKATATDGCSPGNSKKDPSSVNAPKVVSPFERLSERLSKNLEENYLAEVEEPKQLSPPLLDDASMKSSITISSGCTSKSLSCLNPQIQRLKYRRHKKLEEVKTKLSLIRAASSTSNLSYWEENDDESNKSGEFERRSNSSLRQ